MNHRSCVMPILLATTWFMAFFGNASTLSPKIIVFSDVEGNVRKWRELTSLHPGFYRDTTNKLWLRPGYQFVYLGDVLDFHSGELEILEDLNSIQQRQPAWFTIIGGNRDYNKLATLSFTRPDDLKEALRLRSAGSLFEGHREQLIHRSPGLVVDDLAVAKSLNGLVKPGGLLHTYLARSQIARLIAGTLFVHGGIHSKTVLPTNGRLIRPSHIHLDIVELNQWLVRQIGNRAHLGEMPLDRYQSHSDGAIFGSYSNANWMPELPDIAFIESLLKQGIYRIVVGHRPYGPTGAVLRYKNFEILMMDSSGCDDCAPLMAEIQGTRTRILNHRLPDGSQVDATWDLNDVFNPVGHYTQDGWLIVSRTTGNKWILFRNPGAVWKEVEDQNLDAQVDSKDPTKIHYTVKHTPKLVTDEALVEILNTPAPKPRVAKLSSLHGADLTAQQHSMLMQNATALTNSFEIIQYVRLAEESKDSRWRSQVAAWFSLWDPPQQRWQVPAREACLRILASLTSRSPT